MLLKIASIAFFCLHLLVSLNGCAYRPERQQGQIVEQEQLLQVKVGMSQRDVALLIGEPLLTHPFGKNQWIYTYYLWKQDDSEVKRNIIIDFDKNNLVSKITRKN